MIKCCKTCIFFAPQVIGKDVYSDGRCIHIAFIRAGMSKIVDGKQFFLNRDINNITHKEIIKFNKEGYIFYDFLKILGHRLKICDHWVSQLSFANKALRYYKDSIENYEKFKSNSKLWFEEGCCLKNKRLKSIEKRQNICKLSEIKEVPELYLNYESCATCEFFRYEVREGIIEPLKGRCLIKIQRKDYLNRFKINKIKCVNTYSFLNCKKHKSIDINIFSMVDKLKYFIGTNPIKYEMDEIKNIYKHPYITQKKVDACKDVKRVDLNKLLLEKYDFEEWSKFKNLEKFKIIGDFFRNNLKKCKNFEDVYINSNKLFE